MCIRDRVDAAQVDSIRTRLMTQGTLSTQDAELSDGTEYPGIAVRAGRTARFESDT